MKVTYDRYPELPRFIKTFVEYTATSLATRSFILFGDIVLDDFSKRYSTIDIIVILERSLWEKDFDELDNIIKKLESMNKDFAKILEVVFVPIEMLENPRISHQDFEGMIVRNLQQELISKYPLSMKDDFLIMNKGEVLYGEDLRKNFPIPPLECFWHQFLTEIPKLEEITKLYPFQYSSCRQRNISLSSVMGVVENSRDLLLFTLEKAFSVKGVSISKLTELFKVDSGYANYSRVFMELRNIIENL